MSSTRLQTSAAPTPNSTCWGSPASNPIAEFKRLGVTSFDSTSSFRQSFMDERDNYHTADDRYSAIRVPQVDGNVALKKAILSGTVSQRGAIEAERLSLRRLREFDAGSCDLDEALAAVLDYGEIVGLKGDYRA